MPLYSYTCAGCGKDSEMLVSSSETPVCPHCGSAELKRQLSATATEGKSKELVKNARAAAARQGHFSNY